MELHPQLIEKNGRNEFVVLPFEEYQTLLEFMLDYEDLKDLRAAKNEKAIPLASVIHVLGL